MDAVRLSSSSGADRTWRDHQPWEPWPEHVEDTTTGVEFFEWTAAAGRWARVDGRVVLGGRALFLGKSASLCVPADDAGVRATASSSPTTGRGRMTGATRCRRTWACWTSPTRATGRRAAPPGPALEVAAPGLGVPFARRLIDPRF